LKTSAELYSVLKGNPSLQHSKVEFGHIQCESKKQSPVRFTVVSTHVD